MPEVFPPPKANPITVIGGLIAEFFYSWVVAISDSNNNLEDRVSTLETTPTIISPTLLNSWANEGAPFEEAGFYKDAHGRVHIRGTINQGTTTSNTVIFTLPEGFRPPARVIFAVVTGVLPFPDIKIARIDVQANGDVILVNGDNIYLSLDGISFLSA